MGRPARSSRTDDTGQADDDTIRLTLPADPEYGRVARTACAGLALRLGFSYPDIEDLRLAVDETLILLLHGGSGGGRITLVFEPTGDGLRLTATTTDEVGPAPDDETRTRFEGLVGPVVDAWELDDRGRRALLVKHRS